MKHLWKILFAIGGLLVLAKLAQLLLDAFYETYGRKYISSQEIE